MKSIVMAKSDFQKLRKDFKSQGFNVKKIAGGYELHHGETLLLKAMAGARGYLVRHVDNLFA